MVKYKKSAGGITFDIALYAFMVLMAAAFLFPFWSTLVLAFTTSEQSLIPGLRLWPTPISLESFRLVFAYQYIWTGYLNTIFRAVVGASLCVFFTMLTAYSISKKTLPLRGVMTFIILFTMFFNGGLVPGYILMRNLGIMNTPWALILPLLTSAWYVFIARNFIMALPDSLEEAAVMDGANPLRILVRIIFPLSMPIISVIGLWSLVQHWNSWFDALLYINTKAKMPLQAIVRNLIDPTDITGANVTLMEISGMGTSEYARFTTETLIAASIMVSIGPIIVVYPFLQKYFVKGILVGSLKG